MSKIVCSAYRIYSSHYMLYMCCSFGIMQMMKNTIDINVYHGLVVFRHLFSYHSSTALLFSVSVKQFDIMVFSAYGCCFPLNHFHIRYSEKPAEQQVLHSMVEDSEMSTYYKHHLLIMSHH